MRFTVDNNKAMQTIIWILNRKPNISKYNIMKVMFSADCYHLNNYGRLIYGESYLAMNYGTVPSRMKDLLEIKNNVKRMPKQAQKEILQSLKDTLDDYI